MDDTFYESMKIRKVFVQVPGEKPSRYDGIAIPNKNDEFRIGNKEYYVQTRIFDPKAKSVTVILESK